MPSPLAALPSSLDALAAAMPPVLTLDGPPPLDAALSAILTALAPVWPAITPWLVVGGAAVVMGVATEVVVRELHAHPTSPRPSARGGERAAGRG